MNTPHFWKHILRTNFTKIEELATYLNLSPEQALELDHEPHFILNLPRRLAEKMKKETLECPIFKQFVPLKKEREVTQGFALDPVQEASFRKEAKLLHKYEGRTLIVSTSACAMHCRYCFRKHFPYEREVASFDKELLAIEQDPTISEVILSGGDPLSLSDRTLQELLSRIGAIPHVRRARFHTRFPIGIPERITPEFLSILKEFPKQIWFVIHSNHPREFDEDIWQALKEVQKLGIPVLNQSVLLQGINDKPGVLEELSSLLIDHGVSPYYVHQLDRVQGISHFEVEETKGRELVSEIQKHLPGYAVPRYVREVPGLPSKTILQ